MADRFPDQSRSDVDTIPPPAGLQRQVEDSNGTRTPPAV